MNNLPLSDFIPTIHNYYIVPGVPPSFDTEGLFTRIYKVTGITKERLVGKSRDRYLVTVRMVAMKIMREHGKFKLVYIGKKFNRDHGTVIYSIKQITDRMGVYKETKLLYDRILAID